MINVYVHKPEETVVIWAAAVRLSLIDRCIQVPTLLVSEERARDANLDRKVTQSIPLNRIIPLLGIVSSRYTELSSIFLSHPPSLSGTVNDKRTQQFETDKTLTLMVYRGAMKLRKVENLNYKEVKSLNLTRCNR